MQETVWRGTPAERQRLLASDDLEVHNWLSHGRDPKAITTKWPSGQLANC